jgi:hypothetical protein
MHCVSQQTYLSASKANTRIRAKGACVCFGWTNFRVPGYKMRVVSWIRTALLLSNPHHKYAIESTISKIIMKSGSYTWITNEMRQVILRIRSQCFSYNSPSSRTDPSKELHGSYLSTRSIRQTSSMRSRTAPLTLNIFVTCWLITRKAT